MATYSNINSVFNVSMATHSNTNQNATALVGFNNMARMRPLNHTSAAVSNAHTSFNAAA